MLLAGLFIFLTFKISLAKSITFISKVSAAFSSFSIVGFRSSNNKSSYMPFFSAQNTTVSSPINIWFCHFEAGN